MAERRTGIRPAGPARSARDRSASGPPGPDRVVLGLYGLLAIAASGRSGYQLLLRPADAQLAYWLSAGAAVAYLIGLGLLVRVSLRPELTPTAILGSKAKKTALARPEPTAMARVALAWCALEFLAVLAVGSWTLLQPARFRVPTVWSYYGAGYGFLPALLPVAAGWWLRTRRTRPA